MLKLPVMSTDLADEMFHLTKYFKLSEFDKKFDNWNEEIPLTPIHTNNSNNINNVNNKNVCFDETKI